MISLGTTENFMILSGNQIGNELIVNGDNTVTIGDIGYTTIINNPSSSITAIDGNNPASPLVYSDAIIDLNLSISAIGNLDFVEFNQTDIGSISSLEFPLPPGYYLFNNPTEFISTLYLSGVGQYVFYFMSTFTINSDIIQYFYLQGGISPNDIFFYSPYDINLNTSLNGTIIYGNYISDLNITDTSSGSFNIFGRYLSSTGNVTLSNSFFSLTSIPCYIGSSLIQMDSGNYKKIEDIKFGDSIMCYGHIINNSEFIIEKEYSKIVKFLGKRTIKGKLYKNSYPIKIKKYTFNDLPFEDLIISPLHRIKTEDNNIGISSFDLLKRYENEEIEKMTDYSQKIVYYHIQTEDEKHSIIKVNGILSETLNDYNGMYKKNFEIIFNS
jgi:hypothetical protein